MNVYDHDRIASLRAQNWTWAEIVTQFPGSTVKKLTQAHSLWRHRQNAGGPGLHTPENVSWVKEDAPAEAFQREVTLTTDQVKRIKSLEDLTDLFDVDQTQWQVIRFWVTGNSWDQSVKDGTVAHQYKVTAEFARRLEAQQADLRECWDAFLADAADHAPVYKRPESRGSLGGVGEAPTMAVLAIFDPHFAMLSWRQETGADYDLGIATRDYANAVEKLLSVAGWYELDKILYVVGNDTMHVDNSGHGGKGGATTAGTAQDVDSRRPKMFTQVRQALVAGIDQARVYAPVEVLEVPGNHDQEEMYRMGEVLAAWYRNDPEVQVTYSPNKRKYVLYGKNALMFTHGEEFKRKRDPLPLVMATEIEQFIPGAWAASQGGYREILTGHNHAALAGGYYPLADQTESRGIRVVSLAGMTPVDAWHHTEGYQHHRAASLRVYYKSGGLAGHHEVTL